MSIGIAGQRIITRGMGVGYTACGDGLITTHFSLLCRPVEVPPERPPGGGGGGPYPEKMDAWNQFDNAQDIFQPVDKDIYDPNKIYKTKKEVIIRVEFGNFHMEKTYLVPLQRANVVVKVIHLFNATRSRINIGVSKIKRVLHRIKVSVSGLRRKK